MKQPLASIIVPVFDDALGLRTTLHSLRSMTTSVPFEIIVCDDCGPSEIFDIASEFGCRHVRLDVNSGSYAARNAGIAAARSERIAFVDADQEACHEWLDQGIRAIEDSPYVGGRIVVRAADMCDAWVRYDCTRGFPPDTYVRNGSFPTGNLFVTRQLFRDLGPFNGSLRSTGDTEFADRVRNAGILPGFNPSAVTYHPARNKAQLLQKTRRIAAGRAQLYLLVERQPFKHVLARELFRIVSAPARFAWRVATKHRHSDVIGAVDHLRFFAFDEMLLILRSYWIIAYCGQIKRGEFEPFQDSAVTDPSVSA